jgi:transcriptional adapter 2-alpha
MPTFLDLKLSMLEIYFGVLQRRMAKKQFVFEHGLIEFKRQQSVDKMRSKEDRDVFHQIKPYSRFMNPEVFDDFLSGLVREEELRRKNQMLQEYRRHGLRTFAEVSRFEAEKKHLELYLKGGSSLARNPLPAKEPFALPSVAHSHHSPSEPSYNDFRPSNSSSGGGRRLGAPLNISNAEGAEMLSEKERQICSLLRLYPRLYLSIKDTLIREYMKYGGLKRAQARAALKIDVNKTSRLYDFFVSAGWIKPPASGE